MRGLRVGYEKLIGKIIKFNDSVRVKVLKPVSERIKNWKIVAYLERFWVWFDFGIPKCKSVAMNGKKPIGTMRGHGFYPENKPS